MARRMAKRFEDLNAGHDLSATFDKPPILPCGKDIGDALSCGAPALRQFLNSAWLRPEIVLRTVDHQLRLRKDGSIGSPLHQAPDMVRVEMRDEDCADLRAINSARSHIARQVSRVRLPLTDSGSRVDHDVLV